MIHKTSVHEEDYSIAKNWTTGLLVIIPIPIPDVVVVIRQETLLLVMNLAFSPFFSLHFLLTKTGRFVKITQKDTEHDVAQD